MRSRWMTTVPGVAVLAMLFAQSAGTQQRADAPGTDWPMYRHDKAGTGFSPLLQIDVKNVASLLSLGETGP